MTDSNQPTATVTPAAPDAATPPRRAARWLWMCLAGVLLIAAGYVAFSIHLQFAIEKELVSFPLGPATRGFRANAVSLKQREKLEGILGKIADLLADCDPSLPILGSRGALRFDEPLSPQRIEALREAMRPLDDDIDWVLSDGQFAVLYVLVSENGGSASDESESARSASLRQLVRVLLARILLDLPLESSSPPFGRFSRSPSLVWDIPLYLYYDIRPASRLARRSIESRVVTFVEHAANSPDGPIYATHFENRTAYDYPFRAGLEADFTAAEQHLADHYKGALRPGAKLTILQRLGRPFTHGVRGDAEHLGYLRAARWMLEAARRPSHQRIEAIDHATERVMGMSDFYGAYAKQRITPYATAVRLDLLVTARLRAAATAIGVLKYRNEFKRLPDSLDQLNSRHLSEVGIDPYTGQPLRYRRLESGGFVVYSVGEDGLDDDGRRTNAEGVDFGPGADVPFTVLR